MTMKVCKKCGQWISEPSDGKCPFCGYFEGDGKQPNGMAGTMKLLIEQRGADIIFLPKQFYALLADILPEHKQEKALVRRVMLDSPCYKEMFEANQKTDAQKSDCIMHNVAVLESQHFMSRENAAKALVWFAIALGWDSSTYADCLGAPVSGQTADAPVSGQTADATTGEAAPLPLQSPPELTFPPPPEPVQPDKATSSPPSAESSPPLLRKASETLSNAWRKFLRFLFLAFLWIVGVFTWIGAISSMMDGGMLASVFLAVAGLLVVPPVHQKIRKLNKGSAVSFALFIALWVAWFMVYPSASSSQPDAPSAQDVPTPAVEAPALTETEPAPAPYTPEDVPADVPPMPAEDMGNAEDTADFQPEEGQAAETQSVPDASGYLYPSDERPITRDELRRMSREEIVYIRNEIFARYGYVFVNEDIQAYFNAKSWYHANPLINASTFNDTNMTPMERKNLQTITSYETEQGWRVENADSLQEGDYLYPSDTRRITRTELQKLSREEISYIRNEIFARYGYTFVNEDIRNYFNGKSWYRANPNINADTFGRENMTPIERDNLDAITQYEKERGWRK